MLVGVAIYAKVFAAPGEFADLRLDSLSTLFYVANWHFIFGGSNYFDLTAQPSPLAHMWSLSIEEQFYIVWPPVVLVMLRLGRKLRPVPPAVAGARPWRWSAPSPRPSTCGCSYHGGASVMRLYEGTDTRCQDILVGAALAIGHGHLGRAPHGAARRRSRHSPTGRSDGPTRRPGPPATVPPRPHRRDLHRRRGPASGPSPLGRSPPAAGAARPPGARVVGAWSSALFALDPGDRPQRLPVRGRLLPLRPRGGRGHLLRGHRPAGVAVPGPRQPGLPLRRARSPTAPISGTSRSSPCSTPPASTSTATRCWPSASAVTLVVATASFYLVEEPIRRGRMRTFTEWRAWLMTVGGLPAGWWRSRWPPPLPVGGRGRRHRPVVGTEYTGPPVKVACCSATRWPGDSGSPCWPASPRAATT